MNANKTLDLSRKVIVAANIVLVRIDAFLNNYIELTSAGLFLLLFAKFEEIISSLALNMLIALNVLALIVHLVYSIVYIVNDYIDFEEIQGIKKNKDLYSFYEYRPIIYFNKSKIIMIYFISLYILGVTLISLIFKTVLVYPPLLAFIAFIHSKTRKFRFISFAALRTLKYVLYFNLSCSFLSLNCHTTLVVAFLIFLMSLLIIHTNTYRRSKMANNQLAFPSLNSKLLSSYIAFGITTLLVLLYLSILIPFTMVVVFLSPLYLIREILRLKFKLINPNFYVHLERLFIFFLSMILFSLLVFILVL